MKENTTVLLLHPNTILATSILGGVALGSFAFKYNLFSSFKGSFSFFYTSSAKKKAIENLNSVITNESGLTTLSPDALSKSYIDLRLELLKKSITIEDTETIEQLKEIFSTEIAPLSKGELAREVLKLIDTRAYLKNLPKDVDLTAVKQEAARAIETLVNVRELSFNMEEAQEIYKKAFNTLYNNTDQLEIAQKIQLNHQIDIANLTKTLQKIAFNNQIDETPTVSDDLYRYILGLGEEGSQLDLACKAYISIKSKAEETFAMNLRKAESVINNIWGAIPENTLIPNTSTEQIRTCRQLFTDTLTNNPECLEIFQTVAQSL